MYIVLSIILFLISIFLGYKLFSLKQAITRLNNQVKEKKSLIELKDKSTDDEIRSLSHSLEQRFTELQRKLTVAKSRARLLESVTSETPSALFLLDENTDIHFSDKTAKKWFSSARRHEDLSIIEVVKDHRILDAIRTCYQNKASHLDKIEINKSSYQIEVSLLEDHLEIENGAWLKLTDITKEINTAQTQRDFISNASHELKTPLTVIQGYLEILESDPAIEKDSLKKNAIATMFKHSDRLCRIVNDMLKLAYIEETDNEINLHKEDLNLVIVAKETISQLTLLIQEHNVKIKEQYPTNGRAIINGDCFYWDQIFLNLIENSIKHNQAIPLEIEIKIEEQDTNTIVEITDNGIGIPESDLEDIFKRFYQVDKQHSQNQVKGTGLGLSIVKRAVEAHQGKIEISSVPGERTTFSISLPKKH